jgi:hypothetical protein
LCGASLPRPSHCKLPPVLRGTETANACHKTPVLPNRRSFPPTPERPPPSRPRPHARAKRRLLPPGPSLQIEARQGSELLQRWGQRRRSLRSIEAQPVMPAEDEGARGAGRRGGQSGVRGRPSCTRSGGVRRGSARSGPAHSLAIVPPPTRVGRVQGKPSARAVAGGSGPSLSRAFPIATPRQSKPKTGRHVTPSPPLPPRQQPRSSRQECACARLSLAGRAIPLLKNLRSACRVSGNRRKRPLARKWRQTAPCRPRGRPRGGGA